jgi:hypothetical protein
MSGKKREVMLIPAETPGYPLRADKAPGRNDPCPCKSGKKVKNCCGIEKKYYQRIPKDKVESDTDIEAKKRKIDNV